MNNMGGAFRLTGFILGIVAIVCGICGVIFSAVGMHQARVCKHCTKGVMYK